MKSVNYKFSGLVQEIVGLSDLFLFRLLKVGILLGFFCDDVTFTKKIAVFDGMNVLFRLMIRKLYEEYED